MSNAKKFSTVAIVLICHAFAQDNIGDLLTTKKQQGIKFLNQTNQFGELPEFTRPAPITGEPGPFPESFRKHLTEDFTDTTAYLFCDLGEKNCLYDGSKSDQFWFLDVNEKKKIIRGKGVSKSDADFEEILLTSRFLKGTKCLYISAFTSSIHINFVVSVSELTQKETVTALPGHGKVAKQMTVGIGIKDFYLVKIYLYFYTGSFKLKHGQAYIGRIALVDGPCSTEIGSLDCTFDYGLCDWNIQNKKKIWHPVPVGLHHKIPHKVEYGALATFKGKGHLWSPAIPPIDARCFTFTYARGETEKSYLRVWLLYQIPEMNDGKVILYEDLTNIRVLKKRVSVNIYVPYKFQIAFEGQSKDLMNGIVVFHTAISPHRCSATGTYSDVPKGEDMQPSTESQTTDFTFSTSTVKTTPFGPLK